MATGSGAAVGPAAATPDPTPDRPERARRSHFHAAALSILAAEGAAGLRVGSLCRSLKVTSGSFYHHFTGWADFVRTLLDHHERRQVALLSGLSEPCGRDAEAMFVLRMTLLALPHDVEAAVRGWAATAPDVRATQRRIDTGRGAQLEKFLSGVVDDPVTAQRMAVLAVAVVAGYQQTCAPPAPAVLEHLLEDYERIVVGYSISRQDCHNAEKHGTAPG